MRHRLLVGAVLSALLLAGLPTAGSPGASPAKPSTKRTGASSGVPVPADGDSYFGFVFRLADAGHRDALARGDTRPFPVRLRDAVDVELGGKPPTAIRIHAPWQRNSVRGAPMVPFGDALKRLARVESAVGANVLLDILWVTGDAAVKSDDYGGITTKDIAAGHLDDYIRQYAKDVRRWGEPVLIRLICQEFNGAHNHNCAPMANPELTPSDFVAAWRRVVDIFRSEGAHNASWAWVSSSLPPAPKTWGKDRNIGAYYPGDEYVDWIGVDFYDFGPPSWLEPTYQFSLQHQKPLMIGEFGVRHPGSKFTPAEDQAWLNAMFDFFETHPNIKAFTYSNFKNGLDEASHMEDHVYLYDGAVNYHPNAKDGDHRLIAESGADFRGTFARRIADPRYRSWPSCPGPRRLKRHHLVGTDGRDRIRGTSGRNVICGGRGRDRLSGKRGKDIVIGGPGRDMLRGGPGNDKLVGKGGRDVCRGGPGRDRYRSCQRRT